jgi:natural product precursor
MKRLENLGRSLSKNEMKKILGGSCSCTCTNRVGSWTYDNNGQPPTHVITNDVNDYCGTNAGSGATCTGCTNYQM